MKIIKGKRYFESWRFTSILDMLRQCAEQYPHLAAYRFRRHPGGHEIRKSYIQLLQDIESIGTALSCYDIDQHTMAAVYGDNSYEWAVAYNAIINGPGVVVPLDKLLPAREVAILAKRANTRILFFGPKQEKVVRQLAADNQSIEWYICMDHEEERFRPQKTDKQFVSMQQLLEQGRQLVQKGDNYFSSFEPDPASMSALFFTSGTTSEAKGVMLSQNNICSNIQSISGILPLFPGERALSILPLHHTFENTVGMYYMLYSGVCICFTDGLRYIMKNMQEWQIECMIAVPLLFENVYAKLQKNLQSSGKAGLIGLLRPVARRLSHLGLDVRRRIFSEILEVFGGKLRLVVVGAANIDAEIIQTFNDFGIEFYMGYGLTEAAPVIAACHRQQNAIGSVGTPLPDIEVAIDTQDDQPESVGEILTRSQCVMLGYYENQEATSEVLTQDGWLRTGDIGRFDEKGSLFITGRTKSMIVLNNGKKVFPEEIEQLITQVPGIKDSMVWGQPGERDSIDICALLRIQRDEMPEMANADDKTIQYQIKKTLQAINHGMPSYKSIRFFLLTEEDFIKTTTLKTKRPVQQQKIEKQLKAIGMNMRQANGQFLEKLNWKN